VVLIALNGEGIDDNVSNVNNVTNMTVQVNEVSDLTITSQNIAFIYDAGGASEVPESGELRQGINLTINVTTYNQGTLASGAFYVLFYDNVSQFYNVSMDSVAAGGYANATAYWNTLAGTHNITVMVDPNNNTQDSDPGNNNASKLINVSAWQKYYGNIRGNYLLTNSSATAMQNWTWDNTTNIGYLYVVNKSVSINWSALHPLGYDRNNALNTSGYDFLDADFNLGMRAGTGNATGFVQNNISELFTNKTGNNYGNISTNKTTLVAHGRTINNVPIVNSTSITDLTSVESASFITGILWDDTKDTNGYYGTTDKEDLVFITRIRPATNGLQGTVHNYEIAVPESLNSITGSNVDIFVELT
jgi:hypothetical protein